MRYFGHPSAMLLDGGFAAWLGDGGDKSEDGVEPPEAPPATVNPQDGWTIPIDELRERYQDPALALLDIRTDKEADDDLNGLLHHGQIPGSIRLPWTEAVRDDAGRLKDPTELAQTYQQIGVTPDREVIVVARFGVETGQPWLVLSLLGYPRIRVFDRGWAHWGRKDLDLPLEPLTPLA
jgi:thiosulfate/3-mercaptopyruvate sulfurtransferase